VVTILKGKEKNSKVNKDNIKNIFDQFPKESKSKSFFEIIKNYREKFDFILKKYGLFEKFKNLNEETSFNELMNFLAEFAIRILFDKKGRKIFLKLIEEFLKSEESLIPTISIDAKDFYEKTKKNIKKAFDINEKKVFEIIISYFEIISKKVNIEIILNSLLITKDLNVQIKSLAENVPIKDFFEIIYNTFLEIIENNDEKQFKLYFFDWVLKFGYISEGYIKNILYFLLKLEYLFNNVDLSNIEKKFSTIGKIEKELEINQTLSKYRNAIFHTSFILDYNLNFQERKIIFQDFKVEKKLDILEFISYFYKFVEIINVFDRLLLTFIPLSYKLNPIKEIIDELDKLQ